MRVVVKLDEVLYARRMTLTELSAKVGITLANLSILKTGKAKGIRFPTLLAICDLRYSSVTALAMVAALTASRELAAMVMVVESPCGSAQTWRRRLSITRSR